MPERKQNNTSLITNRNAKAFIRFLRDSGIPFRLICSNYTIQIQSPVIEKKFIGAYQSNRAFSAFSKVKADVRDKPKPDIDKNKLVYFLHDFKQSANYDSVINIDLKSAYATILYMDGLISEETYTYLSTIPKQDRLAAVGMLASRKKIFDFDQTGKIYHFEQRVSELENFFFYAVKRTYGIMSVLKKIAGNRYLFTWVDGIYFLPDIKVIKEACGWLEYINFKYSFEPLTDFKLNVSEAGAKLSFLKDGKQKMFSLPPRITEFNTIMADAITIFHDQNTSKHESSKVKNPY